MPKKGSKSSSGRRSSLVAQTDMDMNSSVGEIGSKYTVITNSITAEIKTFDELKGEHTTLEEIRDAVRTLSLDNVLPLLQELLAKFDVQQARDTVLTEWIKTILLIHTAYFMKIPQVVQKLSSIYQALEDRLTVYPKLLAMHGRLDLIQGQIDSRNRKDEDDEFESDIEQAGDSDSDEDEDEDDEEVDEDDEDDLMDMDSNDEVSFTYCMMPLLNTC